MRNRSVLRLTDKYRLIRNRSAFRTVNYEYIILKG